MENKINIANILRDCPMGTKLYSPLFGAVELLSIGDDDNYPIAARTEEKGFRVKFTEEGCYICDYRNAQYILFPSLEMRDWSKFFKHGDVVIKNGSGMAAVFDGWANDTYTEFNTTVNLYCDGNTGEEEVCDTLLYRKATEDERKQFIEKVERILKGKYNHETLQVEPEKPKCSILAFDRVLVRDYNDSIWKAGLFSHYLPNKEYPYICIGCSYRHCIPYNEHTAHLLGTTDPYTLGGDK